MEPDTLSVPVGPGSLNERLARINGAGRLVPEDAPAELAEAIAEFIGAGTPAVRKTY